MDKSVPPEARAEPFPDKFTDVRLRIAGSPSKNRRVPVSFYLPHGAGIQPFERVLFGRE